MRKMAFLEPQKNYFWKGSNPLFFCKAKSLSIAACVSGRIVTKVEVVKWKKRPSPSLGVQIKPLDLSDPKAVKLKALEDPDL
jgi:hypothetical protein